MQGCLLLLLLLLLLRDLLVSYGPPDRRCSLPFFKNQSCNNKLDTPLYRTRSHRPVVEPVSAFFFTYRLGQLRQSTEIENDFGVRDTLQDCGADQGKPHTFSLPIGSLWVRSNDVSCGTINVSAQFTHGLGRG